MSRSPLIHRGVGPLGIRSAAWPVLVAATLLTEPLGNIAAERAAPGKGQTPAATSERLTQALSEFNRGGALLDRYEYSKAARAFEKVLAIFPDWTAARFNLGLAYLDMGGQGSSEEGKQIEAGAGKEKEPASDAHSKDYLRKAKEAFEEVLRRAQEPLRSLCLGAALRTQR